MVNWLRVLFYLFNEMKIAPDKRLFWFLKDGIELDLDSNPTLDMYVQQMFLQGASQDIKVLFQQVGSDKVKESFGRIKSFLPQDVRLFWKDYFGDT